MQTIIHVATIGPAWLWHPLGQCAGNTHEVLRCKSYNLWSGIISDVSEITLLGVFLGAAWRVRKHFECHVELPKNCHRIGHPVLGTGHRACRRHHPHAETPGAITQADILRHHEQSGA